MRRRIRAPDQWTEGDRAFLRKARRSHGHNQTQCAAALVALGAAQGGQRTVSAWETGKTEQPGPENVEAIRLYVLESGLEGDEDATPQSGPESAGDRPLREEINFAGMSLREVVARRVAGMGTPMSESDLEALRLAYPNERDRPEWR